MRDQQGKKPLRNNQIHNFTIISNSFQMLLLFKKLEVKRNVVVRNVEEFLWLVDQYETLADNIELSEKVYLVRPTGIQTRQPLYQQAATLHFVAFAFYY